MIQREKACKTCLRNPAQYAPMHFAQLTNQFIILPSVNKYEIIVLINQ